MRNLPMGTITLLFADIEGSTQLLQELGDDYAEVLTKCRHLLRAAFYQWSGHEVDEQGDAFFVVFTRAIDGVSAAIAAQRSLANHPWPQGTTVRVRMGLHTGEPELTSEGYIGLDVHRAARIMNAGHGGQVLLSPVTRELVEHDLPDGVSLRDLGEHRLKDIEPPCHLFQMVIPDLPTDFPPLKTLDIRLHNLPIQPTSFIGREQEMAAVSELLRRPEVRLLTLTGTVGVGKTRLALQVATDLSDLFPDGVFFVALSLLSNTASVISTIAQVLDVGEGSDQPLLERLKASLRRKRILLVLDNFEQVVDAALIVADLLTACPKLKVLVTSRVILHLQAEQVYTISSLGVPNLAHLPEPTALSQYEAVALFVQRAQAARPDFQLTNNNASAVAAICERLDGLPLAIELAAERVKYFSPQSLLKQLKRGLVTLKGRARDLPARQQTLQGAIAWSYGLLEQEEQKLFRRLAVFPGGCTLEAARQVCTSASELESDVLEVLIALVDKNLLRQEEQEEGSVRYWMLQTLREYGLECLAREGEKEATRDAHATYYLALSEEASTYLAGAEQAAWYDRLEQEHANLQASLEWMLKRAETEKRQAEHTLQFCLALMEFWEIRGHFREGRIFLEQALALSEGVVSSVRGEVLYAAGFLAHLQDDNERAEALLQESLILFRSIGDKPGMAKSLRILGGLAGARNSYRQARSHLEEAFVISMELGDKKGIASTREFLAQVYTAQGNYSNARMLLEENLALYSAMGELYHTDYVLYNLARVLFLSKGDQEKAYAFAQKSLSLFREVGHKRFIAYALGLLGQVLLQYGEDDRAHELSEESVVTFRDLEYRIGLAESLIYLARIETCQDNATMARAHYEESWAQLRKMDEKELSAACLEGLGEVAVVQQAPSRAAQLWGTAATLRAAIGAPMPPAYRATYERSVAAARTQIGERSFAAAWAKGRNISLEQALLTQE